MSPAVSYLKTFFITLACGLVCSAVFSIAIDSYGIYGTPRIKYFNADKPQFGKKPLIGKSAALLRIKPNAVIIGSSRAEIGLDPTHPGWGKLRCYNLGSPLSKIYKSFLYFHQAHAIRPLRQVLLTTEFSTFLAPESVQPDYREEFIAVLPNGSTNFLFYKHYLQNLISGDSLSDSWKTLRRNIMNHNVVAYSLTGQRIWGDDKVRKIQNRRGGYRQVFKREVQRMVGPTRKDKVQSGNNKLRILLPVPNIRAALENPLFIEAVKYFRAIIKQAYHDRIDVRMVISPSHAWFWETIWARGQWSLFEEWKRIVVRVNGEEAQRVGMSPFPIWDFSGYNSITTETVPPQNDTTAMNWYWEASHYTQAAGDLILDRVLKYKTDTGVPRDFGVLINSANIERHLIAIRKAQASYRATHSRDFVLIKALAQKSGF